MAQDPLRPDLGPETSRAADAAPADPVQNPLTLVMRIRSPEDYKVLNQTLEDLFRLPPTENPVTVALDKLANVHFARFVFLENNTRLAVITTYDGDFEDYITDFVDEIGDVFDTLLKHIEGAESLPPVRNNREEFLAFVRAHDEPYVRPFYSAYPALTVLDIQHLAQQQM